MFNLAKPTEYESSTQERRTNYTEMIALLSKKKKKKRLLTMEPEALDTNAVTEAAGAAFMLGWS